MDPKEVVKAQQHIKVMQNALTALSAACTANDDARIREAMKVYRVAEQKLSAMFR